MWRGGSYTGRRGGPAGKPARVARTAGGCRVTARILRAVEPTDDPQEDEDDAVRQARDRFGRWALAARGTAAKNHAKGDAFGERLANARADVYDRAAALVKGMSDADAAVEMMSRAKHAHIRTPPLIDFDDAGAQYTVARAWQFCAWHLDPELPEVQPKWK